MAIGFALVGLPSPVVFGAVAAVASLIPFVGTAMVWVPAAAVLLLQGRWVAALLLAAWSAAVMSSADNVIRPFFISGRARIATLPVFQASARSAPSGSWWARWWWPSPWPGSASRRRPARAPSASSRPARPRPPCGGSAC